jgi:hypothetical protein
MYTLNKRFFAVAASVLFFLLQGCGKSEVASEAKTSGSSQVSKPAEAVPAPPSYAASITSGDLVGSWTAGTGKGTIVALPDGSLTMTNESNMVANGKISGSVLECQDWKVTGRLSQDKRSLVWSNGAVWKK